MSEKEKNLLDAELDIFRKLEERLDLLLKKMSELKKQRDRAIQQKSELESLLRRRETQIAELKDKLASAQRRTISPEKEKVIKERLQGLLNRLQEFET